MVITFSIQGFRLFNSLIDIVLIFEFGHDISILKVTIFGKVDDIEFQPALPSMVWLRLNGHKNNI